MGEQHNEYHREHIIRGYTALYAAIGNENGGEKHVAVHYYYDQAPIFVYIELVADNEQADGGKYHHDLHKHHELIRILDNMPDRGDQQGEHADDADQVKDACVKPKLVRENIFIKKFV
jgi:hypothetical protein